MNTLMLVKPPPLRENTALVNRSEEPPTASDDLSEKSRAARAVVILKGDQRAWLDLRVSLLELI
jgi:hypothetical protein